MRSAKHHGIEQVVVKTKRVGFDSSSVAQELRLIRDIPPSPYVVRVLGLCVDAPDGELGIVMELCEHGSLASFLKEQCKVREGHGMCVCTLCAVCM